MVRVKTVYMQGRDTKAAKWTQGFHTPVRPFTTLRDMLRILFKSERGDVLVYRYQNNPPKLVSALAVTTVLMAQLLKAALWGMPVIWICHNVGQDTLPYHKGLERFRRGLLAWRARLVFVLDPLFVEHCVRRDAIAISFGPKDSGSVKAETVKAVADLATRVDRVILIAGQDGGKYKSFDRIPDLHRQFAELGLQAGFVTAGMAPGRRFDPAVEDYVLRIHEPDIDERVLAAYFDFVYRENDDISMPYTVYSAATAGIPVLTNDDSVLAKILERERIGLSRSQLGNAEGFFFDFAGFLRRHQWDSLQHALRKDGIQI